MTKLVAENHNKYYVWLDYYKIIFTFGVCFMHFESTHWENTRQIFEGMYLAVDFFFVLSGYFIYQSYEKSKQKSVKHFLKKRWKEFFSPTVLMLILFLLYDYAHIIKTDPTVFAAGSDIGTATFGTIFEALFLQMFIPTHMYNFPIWYISVLLIVGTVIYYFINKKKGNIKAYILPVLIVCTIIYGYMCNTYGNIDVHTSENHILGIYDGVLRGFADITIGIILYYFSDKIPKYLKSREHWILRACCWICMGWCVFINPHSQSDYIFLATSALVIWLEARYGDVEISQSKKQKILLLRKNALYIYVVHYFICKKIWKYPHEYLKLNNKWIELVLFGIVIWIAGIILMYASNKLDKIIYTRAARRRNVNI